MNNATDRPGWNRRFTLELFFREAEQMLGLKPADDNGDDDPSFVSGDSGVIVLVGDGIGGFATALSSPYSLFDNFANFVVVGDIDGNGLDAVVARGEGITVLLNRPPC